MTLDATTVSPPRRLPNLLVKGFQLGLRNWPLVVWAYGINLAFALLAGIPLSSGLAPYLDHSLGAQRISGVVDVNALGELLIHLRGSSFLPATVHTAVWLSLIQLVFLLLFFSGTIFIYVSAEPPRFSVLLRGGIAYFWRFVRSALAAAGVSAVVLGILFALRWLLLLRAGAVYVERKMFLYTAISDGVVFLAAMLVRLWWDLVEVYIVRNAIDGERRVRQALVPAARLLFRYFFSTAACFLLVGLLGLGALTLCLFLWKQVPPHQVWLAAFLAQVGLFLLLAARFWQRGLEVALVLAIDPPLLVVEDLEEAEAEEEQEREEAPMTGEQVLAGLSEPTLQELVNKLRNEPWANPDAASDARKTIVEEHETKFPLGGSAPREEKETPPKPR